MTLDELASVMVARRMLAFVLYPPDKDPLWAAGFRGQDIPFSLAYAPSSAEAVQVALDASPTACDKTLTCYFEQPATGYLLTIPSRGQPGEGWVELGEREWHERKKGLASGTRPEAPTDDDLGDLL